jgi:large subunit ribosomal protein L3
MPSTKSPRKGSLQFWPRKRVNRFLPSVNWKAISAGKNLKGFIGYKAGMASVEVKDLTLNSMTKDKKIIIPATIIECPPMKIFSIRFYKNGIVAKEVLSENLDKELKRRIKLPKEHKSKLDSVKTEEYEDVSIIAYSQAKKTEIKKKPDITEIGLNGSMEEKMNFIKAHLNKEISLSQIFSSGDVVDFRGLTKGKGFQGPIKRFGAHLRFHKSEKGVRKIGSIGPWHPARVTFRVPMAGQMGMFTRVHYNQKVISIGKAQDLGEKLKDLKNYGNLNTDYLIVAGSVQGVPKRPLMITSSLRTSKMQKKKNYEFIEVKR